MLALSDDLDVHPEQLVAQDENLALVRLERHKRGEVTQSPGFVAVMHDDALGLGCLAEPLVCAWSQNETNQRRQCNSKLCLSNSFGEQQRRCARTVCLHNGHI